MELKKATLRELPDQPNAKATAQAVPVQINPATLRLQAAASVDSGKNANRQRSQYQGTTSTLSFDLVFDTADEGTTDAPVDVRTRTAAVEKFVWPAAGKTAPPRVEFTYGTFSVVGVMTGVNVDLDLFSGNGVPLRAKCSVTIKEQRLAFDLTVSGVGSKTAWGATSPVPPTSGAPGAAGAAAGAPGAGSGGGPSQGSGAVPTDRTGTALAGETASGFAARMGLDPRAWKGLQGLADPLRLQAGQQIDFSSGLSVGLGLGDSTTGIGAALAAAGSAVTRGGSSGGTASLADPAQAAGGALAAAAEVGADPLALTAAGGLTSAIGSAITAATAQAAAAATQAFDPTTPAGGVLSETASPTVTGGSSGVVSGSAPPGSETTPGAASGDSIGAATGATANPPAPVDRRAAGYGFGVPLRPRRGGGTVDVPGLVHERASSVRRGGPLPPESNDVTVPPWQALPGSATAVGGGSRCGCGCGGGRSGQTTCGCSW